MRFGEHRSAQRGQWIEIFALTVIRSASAPAAFN
jgi:hypothetical protein